MCFGILSKKSLLKPRSWRLIPMFFTERFTILALKLRSMVRFQFLYMAWGRGSNFFLMWMDILLTQHHLMKGLFSIIELCWHFCRNQSTINVKVNFWTVTYIPPIYMSIYFSITRLVYHRRFWNWEMKIFQHCSSFLKLFWLFWVIWIPVWTFVSVC